MNIDDNVLTLCSLPSFINKDIIQQDVINYMKSREEYYK